jgi:YD repeat-containing protein
MASETLLPNSIITQTNLTGDLTDLANDPGSSDGNWLDAPDVDGNTYLEVAFPDASGALTTGEDQKFRIRVGGSTGTRSVDNLSIHLYEGATLRSTLYNINNDTITATSAGGQVIEVTWDASLLSTQEASADVRLVMDCTADTHPPASEVTCDVESVAWDVIYDEGVTEGNPLANSLLMTGVGT